MERMDGWTDEGRVKRSKKKSNEARNLEEIYSEPRERHDPQSAIYNGTPKRR